MATKSKIALTIALLLFSLNSLADNPPYPCGTYQQGGWLCPSNGELYPSPGCNPNAYHYPKRPEDTWVFIPEKSTGGSNFWFLQCPGHPGPVELPLDGVYVFIAVLAASWLGVHYIRKKEIS